MPTAADYRRQAETCLSLALSSSDPVVADKLKTMACELVERSLHPEEPAQFPPFATPQTDAPPLSSTKP
jgi:hypothetical protein